MHPYKFGFNVYNHTPEEFLDYTISQNLDHIEINLSKSHSSLESFNPERINNLRAKCSKNQISLSLHLPNQTNIADNITRLRKMNLKYIIKTIALAEQLGAKYINCHMGFFFWFPVEKWQRDKGLNRFIENIKNILNHCANYDIIIAIENVTPLPEGSDHLLLGDNINDFEFVFKQIDSPYVRFCLDTGHANLGEGVSAYIQKFSKKIIAVHYHDNNGNNDSHLAVGKGKINWSNFAEDISKINFQGPFISECRDFEPHEAAALLNKHLSYKASPLKS